MNRSILVRLRNRLRRLAGKRKSYPVRDLRDLSNENWNPLAALALAQRNPVLVTAPLDKCRWTGGTGFPYGPHSAHPYVKTLIQYREHGKPTPKQSYLAQYYAAFQPVSLAEFQGLGPNCTPPLSTLPPLNIYPWTPFSDQRLKELLGGAEQEGIFQTVRSCGPKSVDFVQVRLKALFTLYDTIDIEGFRTVPDPRLKYFDQFPTGDVMVRGREATVILANGQHRAAVLSAMGHTRAPLLLGVDHPRGPFRIDRADAVDWPLVRGGLYSVSEARLVFDKIFDSEGPGPRNLRLATDGAYSDERNR